MKLQEVCSYVVDKIDNSTLNINNYISTENMTPNCGGVTSASNVPDGKSIWFKEGDILFSNIRPYFKKLWKADISGGCSADVLCIRANEKINPTYLYYLLIQDSFISYVMKGTKGCKMPRGDKKYNMAWDIDLPSLEVQKRIADQLSEIDDKIAVNKKICENLEAQAQALFKHWFVDFAPFKDGKFVESELGLIPEGWRVGMIGDYCVIRSGFAFKSSWWQDEGVKVVKIKNITDSGTLDMSDCSCVSEEHASLASSFQTKSGDLLIAMTGATIGKFCMVNGQETYCVNQRVGKFFLGDNPLEKLPFIYCILKRDDVNKEIVNKGQGSAQPNISGKDIEEIKIIIPPQSIINQFNEELYSLFELRINGELENHRLSTLRDTLLPKLMSGQIKVNEIAL